MQNTYAREFRPGPLRSPGLLPKQKSTLAAATKNWHVWGGPGTPDPPSTQSLENNLGTSMISEINQTSYPDEDLFGTWDTDAGDMTGTFADAYTATVQVNAMISNINYDGYIRAKIYHVASNGTETELHDTFENLGPLTGSFANYQDTFSVTQGWTAGDKLRVKFYARNNGIPV